MSAIGSENGHLLNADRNVSIYKTDFSRLKKPDITGLRICIALCIHTGRALNLVNISCDLVSFIQRNIRSQWWGDSDCEAFGRAVERLADG